MHQIVTARGGRESESADRERTGVLLLPHLRPRDIWVVATVWVAWSLGVLFFAAAAAALPGAAKSPWASDDARKAPALARWDAGWYANVAMDGYRYDASAAANNVRFYPLYPVLTGFLFRLTRIPLFHVGIGFSLLCLLAALLLLSDLIAERTGPDTVLPGIAAILVFPTAFYFASFYSESLFLLTTVAAFWGARRGRFVFAGIAGAAASLTRLNGMLIVLPIAWFVWQSAGRKWRSLRPAQVFALAATVAGAAAYPAYLWLRFGSPLIYFRNENSGWAHRPTPVWKLLISLARELYWRVGNAENLETSLNFALGAGSLLLFVLLTVGLFRRRQYAGALYTAGNLLILLNSGSVDAVHRYVLALFPCILLLASLLRKRPTLGFLYLFSSVGLLVTLLTRFVNWIWVA